MLNEQKVTQYIAGFGTYKPQNLCDDGVTICPIYGNATYGRPYSAEAPRYVQIGLTYDW